MSDLHLDIIVAKSRFISLSDKNIGKATFGKLSNALGFTYTFKKRMEKDMKYDDYFPQDALILTHGGLGDGHIYLGYVKKLAEERPDLKFIVRLEHAERHFFRNDELFAYYNQIKEFGLDPNNQVSVTYTQLQDLMMSWEPSFKEFEDYLTKLVELRRNG